MIIHGTTFKIIMLSTYYGDALNLIDLNLTGIWKVRCSLSISVDPESILPQLCVDADQIWASTLSKQNEMMQHYV